MPAQTKKEKKEENDCKHTHNLLRIIGEKAKKKVSVEAKTEKCLCYITVVMKRRHISPQRLLTSKTSHHQFVPDKHTYTWGKKGEKEMKQLIHGV